MSQGDIVVGEVIDIRDYGLMVKINRVQEALLHVSELSHDTVMMKKPLKELIEAGALLRFKVTSHCYEIEILFTSVNLRLVLRIAIIAKYFETLKRKHCNNSVINFCSDIFRREIHRNR